MAFWPRLKNTFRSGRLSREIDEELATHLSEGIREGRDPSEVRTALGPALQIREQSRDVNLLPWLESLRADAVFGWRQILKNRVTSTAAILSLGLAIGACTSAFRLIDALLFRPLPVAGADRLYSLTFESPSSVDQSVVRYDSCSYPLFVRVRHDVQDQAEAVAISMYTGPVDLTFGSDQDIEKVNLQYVSGWTFETFGLHPAAGRLLRSDDDLSPGTGAYAVISYDFWTRRFGRSLAVTGRTFRLGNDVFEIVGVSPAGFNGTETGESTDVFVPMSMKSPKTLASPNNFWLRTLLLLRPGVNPAPIQEKLRATFRSIQEERVKGFPAQSQRDRDRMFQEKLFVDPASSGRSNLQRDYQRSLAVLGMLVGMVLLIACVNVANLMMAQAASRAREMALRVSIGAGRMRLVQLVLLESAWLAVLASAIGGIFAWKAAPYIVRLMNIGTYSARLDLPMDGRVFGFALLLACAVTFVFGLTPALRASGVKPVSALRGGEDPRWRGHTMRSLIAVQVAFCFVVELAAGLFVTTFDRLSSQPMGFSPERILNVEAVTSSPQSPVLWGQVADHLRNLTGIEEVAMIAWPLLNGESAVGNISTHGEPPGSIFADFVSISPGWVKLMKIPLLSGRDFRATDVNPAVAIVNQSFARQYFNGEDPVGKWFDRVEPAGGRAHIQVIGLIRDARSRDRLRWPIRPTAYIPLATVDAAGVMKPSSRATFVVRTASRNPLALASTLRREVSNARPGFRVHNLITQSELDLGDTVKERLLALLAVFFAAVALLLAAVGLYGVLDYSVLQRRREIGIRMAMGARQSDVARRVTTDGFAMALVGAAAGLAIGMASVRYVESLLFQVRLTDFSILVTPTLTIFAVALLATLPAVVRAVRIDPVRMLRME